MAISNNKNGLKLATWVKNFFILDIVVYVFLLFLFPGLWPNGYIFVLVAIGTIFSYLIYEKLVKNQDAHWRKPAEILVTVTVGFNAIFCMIIVTAIIIGVLHAAGSF